jgi:hypothetical protein
MPRLFFTTTAAAFALGLFAYLGQADAAPQVPLNGLTSPALPVVQTYYRHYRRQFYPYYGFQYYGQDYGARSYYYGRYRGAEVRELERAFPSTLWPPSMRY